MYHPVRRRMKYTLTCALILFSFCSPLLANPRAFDVHLKKTDKDSDDSFDNNIIDFDDKYSVKYNKKYETGPWDVKDSYKKESLRYTVDKDENVDRTDKSKESERVHVVSHSQTIKSTEEITEVPEFSVIPLELMSTTENVLLSIVDSTTEPDLTVIPLSTTKRTLPELEFNQTVTLPVSTQPSEDYTPTTEAVEVITKSGVAETISTDIPSNFASTELAVVVNSEIRTASDVEAAETISSNNTNIEFEKVNEKKYEATTEGTEGNTMIIEALNSSSTLNSVNSFDESTESIEGEVPVFTELDADDAEEAEVPEDYYDSKDVVPTSAPKTDALSVIFGFAGSVVESVVETVAERVVPNWIYDIYKRMQKQNEALEAERLRSREENGGLGIKTIF